MNKVTLADRSISCSRTQGTGYSGMPMMKDAHEEAVSYLLSKCEDLPIMSVLTYESYARGDYKPSSDIDLLVMVDSLRYHAKDLKSLVKVCETCRKKFHVVVDRSISLRQEGRSPLLEPTPAK